MRRATAAAVFGCASVLLSYPDDGFAGDLAGVRRALDRLPQSSPLLLLHDAATWLEKMAPMEAATCYVDTFDLRRGTSLYLTYYRHGDTRERGMALSALAEVYRDAGFAVTTGELPDFLPALLELAALQPAGATVLGEHRLALDALRQALDEADSPYAGVVSAVGDALPGPSRADRSALRHYRENGPPSERVGLEPFAPPEVIAQGLTLGPTRR
ncbi:MAG: nitrate reductase molybdenum cofactor assembly chaperone [Acidimicrobiales bacterium]